LHAADPGINQPGAAGNVGRDPGINQPGAAGNVGGPGVDPGSIKPGAAGNVGRDPGINQPGAAGNVGGPAWILGSINPVPRATSAGIRESISQRGREQAGRPSLVAMTRCCRATSAGSLRREHIA